MDLKNTIAMKRIYKKPETKPLHLLQKTFLMAGSGPSDKPTHVIDDGSGNQTIGVGDENSRSWGRGMWDDME